MLNQVFMKQLLFILVLYGFGIPLSAQTKLTPVDKSPMDMAYYPANYPILKIQNKISEPLLARVTYSRPVKSGRRVMGELVEYGKVWRLGANEATELELYRDAVIGSRKIKKGRYTIYAKPEKDKWNIIINRETDTWGAFQYDQTKDLLNIEVVPETSTELVEVFTMMFEKNNNGGANLIIAWDDFKCSVPFGF